LNGSSGNDWLITAVFFVSGIEKCPWSAKVASVSLLSGPHRIDLIGNLDFA